MPVTPSPSISAAIVARLRAAGCVFAEDEARLLLTTAEKPDELEAMVERRVAGLPLEHVLGWAEFCGLRVEVDPRVFVPRRRTELMVAEAAALAGDVPPGPVVLDLCCGAGAVGVALLSRLGRGELHASDIDPAAVRCARRNVARVDGHVYEGDLFEPLPASLRGRVDVLVANVPYVPTDEVAFMPPEARVHEARVALDGGADGLEVARRVAAEASEWLAPGGHLLTETSERQAPLALGVLAAAGLRPRVVRDEELHATVVVGSRVTADFTNPARHM